MKYLETFCDFMNKDWKQSVLDWWNSLSPVSKKAFFWIFGITNLVFIWHTITFFWGNHDWDQIKNGVYIGWSMGDGRWGAGVIQQITGGDILPVWNNLFCFAGFSLGMIYLAKYWKLPKNVFIYTIFGLFIILMPYTPPWLQYVRSETHFWNVFLIIFALYICSFKKWWLYCLAFLLLFFCLSCYAAMMPTIFIIFFGKCVLDIWFDNKTLRQLIHDHGITALIIILSVLTFITVWNINKPLNFLVKLPTVQTVSFSVLLNNLMNIHTGLRDSFFKTLPYIPTNLKLLFGLAIPVVIFTMIKFSKKQNAILCSLFFGILIVTQTTNLLSVENFSNILRIDFWTMPYTYALFWAILLREGKWRENIAILFICISIYYCGLQDIRDQKVKYLDRLSDVRIMEDAISRIKANPKFNPDKIYKVLMLGSESNCFEVTTFDKYNSKMDWQNTWKPFIASWNAQEYMNFYEKEPYVYQPYSECCNPLPDNDLKAMDINYLLKEAAIYPSLKSTHVDDEYIYLIFSQYYLDKLRDRINNLNQ